MRRLIAKRAKPAKLDPRALRERRQPTWRTALRRALPAGLPVLVAVSLVGWLWASGTAPERWAALRSAFDGATAEAGLQVDRVLVAGRDHTGRQALINALGVSVGEPIFAVDLEAARARVAALSWVRDVTIERHLPGTLLVKLVERRPLALWQNDGRVAVVDANGKVIAGADPQRFANLLLVVGPDAPSHAAELLAVMSREPRLRKRVYAAVRVGGRRWNLKLDNGIAVEMPEQNFESAWRVLDDLNKSQKLLARDIATVDLRLPDRLVLQLTPAGMAGMAGKGGSSGQNT